MELRAWAVGAERMTAVKKCQWCADEEAKTVHQSNGSCVYNVCHACHADLTAFEASRDELGEMFRRMYAQWVARWAGNLTFVLSPAELLAAATGDGNLSGFEDEIVAAFATAGLSVKCDAGRWVIVGMVAA